MKRQKIKSVMIALVFGVLLVARQVGAEETDAKRTLTNLKGEMVVVPDEVPDRATLVLLGMQSIRVESPTRKSGLVLALYNNPKSRGLTNYVETYDLSGDLLEITWSDEAGKVRVAQDKSLTDPDAKELAKVLVMDAGYGSSVDERPARLHF